MVELGSDPIGTLLPLGTRRLDPEAQFLGERPADEATDSVRLPAGGFHDLGKGRALLALEQLKYLGFLAALACQRAAHGRGVAPFGFGDSLLRPRLLLHNRVRLCAPVW